MEERKRAKTKPKTKSIYFCPPAVATAAAAPAPAPSLPRSCATDGGCFLEAGVTASRTGGTTSGIARPMPPMMNDHVMMGSCFRIFWFGGESEEMS